ncbi:MAG: hypothetical protein ACRDI3_02670 [Actinomycetota bacterium]
MRCARVGLLAVVAVAAACGPAPTEGGRFAASEVSPSPTPSPERSTTEYVGFHPESRLEGGTIVMPLVFVDGSSAEVVAPPELGIQDMAAAIYTSGGLGGVDRTIDFQYGDGSVFMEQGPLESYRGSGADVEMWIPDPSLPAGCPNLVYRFGDWFIGVRTCQSELGPDERKQWASSLDGHVTSDGFLVLSAMEPLQLQETGGHEGPEMILGYERANWIELSPGACDPARPPDEGDIRTMADGTRVSFSRIGGADSKIEYNWYAEWCEDGLMRVQVSYAYKDFAEAAAESFRLRAIVLAQYPARSR